MKKFRVRIAFPEIDNARSLAGPKILRLSLLLNWNSAVESSRVSWAMSKCERHPMPCEAAILLQKLACGSKIEGVALWPIAYVRGCGRVVCMVWVDSKHVELPP